MANETVDHPVHFPITKILIFFLMLRLALMAIVPVLGDEAYYIYWGMHPAGGYYDLPPMIGWWIAPFAKISLNPFWLRLPNLIALGLLSASIYEWLSHGISKVHSKLIATSFFLAPLPFLGVVMFPDIPLLFLSYFSAYLFFRAATVRGGSAFSFFFSGALMGAAVLSKYFAAFLLPAYFIWFLTNPKTPKKASSLIWFILGGLPFAFQHYLWNETHCWSNIVFNFVTRQNVNDGPRYVVIALFLVFVALVSSPFSWRIFKTKIKFNLTDSPETHEWILSLSKLLGLLWVSPIAVFSLTAILGRGQGLHWLLFILPFFVMWCGFRFDGINIRRVLKVLIPTTGVLSIGLLIVFAFPSLVLKPILKDRFRFEYTQLTHREQFIEAILPEIKGMDAIFTEGYTFSSILNYDLERYSRAHDLKLPEVSVWGAGSRFGRTFDWTTDFKSLDGKKIVIITPGWVSTDAWLPYFNTFHVERRNFGEVNFHVSVGQGLKADYYLKNDYVHAIETYYRNIPPGCSLWSLTHAPVDDRGL